MKSVLDLSPGAGTFGLVCLAKQIGYFCIAWSDAHKVALEKLFASETLKLMASPGHDFHNAKFAADIGKTSEVKPSPGKWNIVTEATPSKQPTGKNGEYSGTKRRKVEKNEAPTGDKKTGKATQKDELEISDLDPEEHEDVWSEDE